MALPPVDAEELGMINFPKSWSDEEYVDPAARMFLESIKAQANNGNEEMASAKAVRDLQLVARDHARVPMQWSRGVSAGFSSNKTTWYSTLPSRSVCSCDSTKLMLRV